MTLRRGSTVDAELATARVGNEAAFADLVERHRRELQVHCYRMVGSFEDSEDLVQETFLRAWRKRDTYAGRSTFRAWLYRIATNACLDFLDRHPRRPRPYQVGPLVESQVAAHRPMEMAWLQPYPDRLLEPVASGEAGPDAMIVARETIELAFLATIQHLPARQRAVLILRDVLDWPVNEIASLLDTSVASAKSALQRARVTLKSRLPEHRDEWAPSSEPTAHERALLQRYIDAHERADLDAMAMLLADDVRVTMPPHPAWLVGRDALLSLTASVFDPRSEWHHGRWRGVATSANRQPAVAQYVERPTADATRGLPDTFARRAQVLDVLWVRDGRIMEITSFEPHLFPAFGLSLTM